MKKIVLLSVVLLIISSTKIMAQLSNDYLIITPDVFFNTSWTNPLLNLQISRGFTPIVATVSVNTTAQQIKNLIAEYYNHNELNLKYVLLIGNGKNLVPQLNPVDTNIISILRPNGTPSMVVDYKSSTYMPFWSTHCLCDWNSNGIDIASDDPYIAGLTSRGPVYIGRIPVTSVQEINNYVTKLQSYYLSSTVYSPIKNREILLNLDVTYPVTRCYGRLVQQLNSKLINGHIPSGVDKVELNVSQHNNGSDAFTYSSARENLFSSTLNAGASVMSILGTNWSRDTLVSWYNVNSGFNLTNKTTAMPFLIGANCNAGEVNNPDRESIMRKLLVFGNGGIIGAFAPTFGTEQYANGYVLNRFNDLLYQTEDYSYGQISSTIKNEMAARFHYLEFYYKALTLFGDPSMYSSIYKHKSLNIAASTTWAGNIVIDNQINVAAGAVLTITPGTNIYFKENASLIVNGTLSADASAGKAITFNPTGTSGTNNIICFSIPSTSETPAQPTSVMKNVLMTNIDGIQCLNGALVNIEGCTLSKSIHGIYIYNSQPSIINNIIDDPQQNGIYGEASGLSPVIRGNRITKSTNIHNYQGIYLGNNTNAIVTKNTISDFCFGGYFGGGGVTYTGYDDNYVIGCNNIITGNLYGLATAWGSITVAGQDDFTGGFNSIYDNATYDVYDYMTGSISAFNNYWGDAPKFYNDGSSTDEIENLLPDSPCGKTKIRNYLTSKILVKDTKDNFFTGIKLEKEGKIDEAIDFYKGLIKKDNNVKAAITQLAAIKNKYKRPEIIAYFESLLGSHNKHYGKVKKQLGDIYLQVDKINEAITAYNDVIGKTSSDYDGINARFEKLFAYLHVKNNISMASEVLAELKRMNLTDQESIIRLNIASDLIEGIIKMKKKPAAGSGNVPNTYALSQNFPNPFNPLTTIKYQIPKAGNVSLKIYDIVGKEIATLVNENKAEGYYEVKFDASRLSSGVYIYQLRSNDFVSSKKMVLVK